MTGSGDPAEGWRAPVHASLVEPVLVCGLPRRFGLLFGGLAAFLLMEFSVWMGPVILVLWVLLAVWHAYDPDGVEVARRFMRLKQHYYG